MRAKRGVLLIGVAVTLALLLGSTALSAKQEGKGKKGRLPNEIPMTANFRDDPSDRIKSDREIGADPVVYDDGVERVRAVLVGARNFVLDTRNSPRSFHVELAVELADCDSEIPTELLAPIEVNFFSTAGLIDDDGNLVEDRLLGMAMGDTFDSDAQMFFAISDTQYFVRFDQYSHHVQITRQSTDVWRIESVGRPSLLSQPLKGRPTTTLVADCKMPFELTVGCIGDCPTP